MWKEKSLLPGKSGHRVLRNHIRAREATWGHLDIASLSCCHRRCKGLNAVSPPSSRVEILPPEVMVLRGIICSFIKEAGALPCPNTFVFYEPGKGVLGRYQICQHLNLGLPDFGTVRNKFLLLSKSPIHGDLFEQPTSVL